MLFRRLTLCSFYFCLMMWSCSKKTTPAGEGNSKPAPVVVKKIKTPVPAVITVNDAVAKKSADGRLYYDLEGKRFWKNYKNGKYYLFNKKMYNNPDFKPL